MKLIIFDGNSILNRAFYGVKPLTTRDGLFTNAVYGFVNIINKHMSSDNYDFAAIAFDLKGATFRHKQYDGYKATRKGMPPELAMQLPYAKQFAELFGLKVLECQSFEADDILGTMAAKAANEGYEAIIITGDRDSYQLVSDTTTVILASTNEDKRYDLKRIRDEFSLEPEQLIEVKALMGDSSDNIPGVKGIGEKTALKLIQDYKSLDGVYDNLPQIKGALHDKLENDKENAYLSRTLATIVKNAPVAATVDDCRRTLPDKPALKALFNKLEFTVLATRLGLDTVQEYESAVLEYEDIEPADLLALASEAEAFISVDFKDGWIFACINDRNVTTPLNEEIFPLFENDKYNLTVWSYKELAHTLLDDYKCELNSVKDDVSLMAYISTPNDGGITFPKVAASLLGSSQADEATSLPKLKKELMDRMKEMDCLSLYTDTELPLAKVLFSMEREGFSVDKNGLEKYSDELKGRLAKLEALIYDLSGEVFNINSPKQLGAVLFEKLKLPSGRKTKTGYSTDADVLEGLRMISPVVEAVLEYRTLSKLKSTYADGLQGCIDPRDGRVHTTFRQTLTMTGRLSSVEPNLQNIPVRTELGKELRRFFVAKEGYVLIDCDYSQIELRVLASISGDANMIEAFNNGDDIHAITASQVFDVPLDMVTSAMRKRAKAVNFGIVYGISDYSLSQDIGVTKKEAARYIQGYFEHYPSVKKYLEDTVAKAKEQGYVTTAFGRRRNVPELKNSKKSVVAFGERVAMNTPIQGTAADIIKKAMLDVYNALKLEAPQARLILQVHDELIIECPLQEAEKVKSLVINKMQECCRLSVPLTVDGNIGRTWFDSKD